MAAEFAGQGNRVGIGVGIDDPGNSTLVYLREINAELKLAKSNAGGTPRVGGPTNQPKAGGQSASQEQIKEVERTERAITEIKTNQLHLFDQQFNKTLNTQIERTRLAAAQMKFNFESAGQSAQEVQRKLYPALTQQPAARFSLASTAEDEAQKAAEEASKFRERTIRRYIESQQRAGIRRDFDFEQGSSRTVDQVLREREVALEQAAVEKVAKSRLNKAINDRAAQIERESAEVVAAQPPVITRVNREQVGPDTTLATNGAFNTGAGGRSATIPANVIGADLPGSGKGLASEAASIQQSANTLTNAFNRIERAKNAALDLKADAKQARENLVGVHREAQALAAELERPASQRRPYAVIEKDLQLLREQIVTTKREAGQLQNTLAQAPPTPPGEGGRGGPLSAQNIQHSGERIFRNLLLYQAFSLITSDLKQYVEGAVEAARASNDLERAISGEATAAQTSSISLLANAEALRTRAGLSRTQARQTELAALRFAEDDPARAGDLASAVTDLAASRGERASQVPEILDQLRQRNSRQYKRYTGHTVEEVYQNFATKQVDAGGGGSEGAVDRFDQPFQTHYDAIKEYVANMSDAQKATAVYDDIIQRASIHTGEASARQEDLGGRLDRLNSRWQDAQTNIGLMITQLSPFTRLIEDLADAVDKVDFGKFKGTGPGGQLLSGDQAGFVQNYLQSPGNQYAGPQSGLSDFVKGLRDLFGNGLQGPGRVIQDILGLDKIIPGAGGARSDAQEAQDNAQDAFFAERRARLLQASREGSFRYRIGEGNDQKFGVTREQLEDRRLAGQDVTQAQGFLEDNEQRLARQASERAEIEADKARREREKEESDQQKIEHERLKKEAQETLNRTANAFAKLREFNLQSYNEIGRVASAYAGPNNPYVQLVTQFETAAHRAQVTYGALGQEVVAFETKLEQQNISLQISAQRFETLISVQRSLGEANRLERERGLGLTGNEQRLSTLYQSGVNAAIQNPELYNQSRRLRFQGQADPTRQIAEQYDNLQRNFNLPSGLGPEAQDAIQGLLDKGIIQLAEKAGPRIFGGRLNGLRLDASQAYVREAERNDRDVDRAAQRVAIGFAAQSEVDRNIDQQKALANRQGGDPRQIERLLDKQILAITGALPTSELSPKAYQGRIDALRRDAVRQAQEDNEAREGVRQGLLYQAQTAEDIRAIRTAISSGDLSMLIQVENDTQARIDADRLKEMGKGLEPKGGLPSRTSQPAVSAGLRNSMQSYGRGQ
jgi:hypothetical protein